MKNDHKLNVAIISSLVGGLGHYNVHLSQFLSQYCNLKFITYPQIDLSGTIVKEITDSFIKKYIKWPKFDLDDNDPTTIIKINNYLNKKEINIVNIHIGTTIKRKIAYFIMFILYLKKVSNINFVFTLHDVLPFDEDSNLTKLLQIFYSLADAYIVGNSNEKEKLIKYFNVSEKKIYVIHHGIYNLFDRNLYNKEIARGYLGLPKDKKIILFFGFLREYKGLNILIKAINLLSKKENSFLVYVASSLKFASKTYVEQNLELIKKFNLQDKFILNFNYLDTLDIEAIFKAIDVVVLPYIQASQSGVLMLALGFKKPVVITESFYDKKWVNNKAGFVAKTENVHDLFNKIYNLISNEQKMSKFGRYGYNYATKHFNWEKIAQQYLKIYKKCLIHKI